MSIYNRFLHIMHEEAKIANKKYFLDWKYHSPEAIDHALHQIQEYAANNLVLRSFNKYYRMTNDNDAYESDGAHTNLMSAITTRALNYKYGVNFYQTDDGYTYYEVIEAASRHDLPENLIGDQPDNGTINEEEKLEIEQRYHEKFSGHSPRQDYLTEEMINSIIMSMNLKSSPTGRLLYMADKLSAIFFAHYLDSVGRSPLRDKDAPDLSERDKQELEYCTMCSPEGRYYASEMWSVDYLKIRDLYQYDDDGYFTALLVMAALTYHGKWYSWREKDYLA